MITPKNLLIVRTDRIGDVVLSLPLAWIVKKHYPECKVTFLVRAYTESLVENHPYIDDVIVLKESNGKILIKDNVIQIASYRFDSVVVVYPTYIVALIVYLSKIKNRVGTGYRWYSFFFNKRVFVHRKYAEKHELEFNVDLLKQFGIYEKINYENVKFDLKINTESSPKVTKILKENDAAKDKPIIIIHPGSGGSSVDLPINKMKELAAKIISKLDVQILLTGSIYEEDVCSEFDLNERVINLAGKLNLSELVSLLNRAEIFIGNSTGPIHIAAALGKYVIGFYPKILACSAKRWGPYTVKQKVFTPPMGCVNCTREQCGKLDCMNGINIDNVMNEVEKVHNNILKNGEFNV
jgi:ADP-heptose:LPS heptosyltransferase